MMKLLKYAGMATLAGLLAVFSAFDSLSAAALSRARGDMTAIGYDGAADAAENPGALGFHTGKHDFFFTTGGRMMSFGATELDLKADSFLENGINHFDGRLTAAYSFHGLSDVFDLALSVRINEEEDLNERAASRQNFVHFGEERFDFEYDQLATTINIHPAFAWSPNENFHLGAGSSVILSSGQSTVRYIGKDSNNPYEELDTRDEAGLLIRPVIGFLYSSSKGRGEMGLRLIPLSIQSETVNSNKSISLFSNFLSSRIEKKFNDERSFILPGRAAVGISDEVIENLLFSVEGRMGLPYNVSYKQPWYILSSGGLALESRDYDLEISNRRGLSVGLTSFHLDEFEISAGFRFDETSGTEILSGDQDFYEIIFSEDSYALSVGTIYTGIQGMKLSIVTGIVQNILTREYVVDFAALDGGQYRNRDNSRLGGFFMDIAWQMTL